jgi:hypothetical protein
VKVEPKSLEYFLEVVRSLEMSVTLIWFEYGSWAPPPMYFHPGWSGHAEGFGHGGYYIGDEHYGSVGHQQDERALR